MKLLDTHLLNYKEQIKKKTFIVSSIRNDCWNSINIHEKIRTEDLFINENWIPHSYTGVCIHSTHINHNYLIASTHSIHIHIIYVIYADKLLYYWNILTAYRPTHSFTFNIGDMLNHCRSSIAHKCKKKSCFSLL